MGENYTFPLLSFISFQEEKSCPVGDSLVSNISTIQENPDDATKFSEFLLKSKQSSPDFIEFSSCEKSIVVNKEALKEAQKLMRNDCVMEKDLKHEPDLPYLGGFKLASGNAIELQEISLKKAEQLMSEDFSKGAKTCMNGITVSVQSMQKAQKLISGVSTSPKEIKLYAGLNNNGLLPNHKTEPDDFVSTGGENDFEFSEWCEEMEQLENEYSDAGYNSSTVITGNNCGQIKASESNEVLQSFVITVPENFKNEFKPLPAVTVDTSKTIEPFSRTSKLMPVNEKVGNLHSEVGKISQGFSKLTNSRSGIEENIIDTDASNCKIDPELRETAATNSTGFSTAAGKAIEISNAAVWKAEQFVLDSLSNEATTFTKRKRKAYKVNYEADIATSAREDCSKPVVNWLPSDLKSCEFEGFKTASGKNLNISDTSLSKAADLMDNSFDVKEEFRCLKNVNSECNENTSVVPLGKKTSLSKSNLSHIFMKELNSKTESLEDDLKVMTSLKSEKAEHNALPSIINSVDFGFKGFESASGKKCNISNLSLKKAVSLMNINAEKEYDMQQKIKSAQCITQQDTVKQIESKALAKDLDQKVPELKSVEEEFEALLSLKKKKPCTNNVLHADKTKLSFVSPCREKKTSKFPPSANIPKGYRPFRAPRIMKPQESAVTSNMDNEVVGNDKVCESKRMKKEYKSVGLHGDSEEDFVQGESLSNKQQDKTADTYLQDTKEITRSISSNANLNPEQVATEQSKDTDADGFYDGLLSQMFADDMEPSENVGLKLSESQDTRIKDKNSSLEQIGDELIIEGSITPETESFHNVSFNCTKLHTNSNFPLMGFSTASGMKLEVTTESLSKAVNLLDACTETLRNENLQKDALESWTKSESTSNTEDINSSFVTESALTQRKHVNSCMKGNISLNETIKSVDPKIPSSQLDDINMPVADLKWCQNKSVIDKLKNRNCCEVESWELGNKTLSDEEVSTERVSSILPSCTFQTASGKQVAISEKALKLANNKFDILEKDACENFGFEKKAVCEINAKTKSPYDFADKLTSVICTEQNGQSDISFKINALTCNYDNIWNYKGSKHNTASKITSDILQENKLDFEHNIDLRYEVRDSSLNSETIDKSVVDRSCVIVDTCYKKNLENNIVSEHQLQLDKGKHETALSNCKDNLSESEHRHSKTKDYGETAVFQTASGKKIEISKDALLAATACLKEAAEMEKKVENKDNSICQTNGGKYAKNSRNVTVASGKYLEENEKVLEKKMLLESNSGLLETVNDSVPLVPVSLFQTASGKEVLVSDNALREARLTRRGTGEMKSEQPILEYKTTIQTSNVRNVTETNIHLFKRSCKDREETIQMVPESGTASLLQIAEVEHLPRETLNPLQAEKVSHQRSDCVFQTASGRNVTVSKSALYLAREGFKTCEANEVKESKLGLNSDFQTASGKCVEFSEKAFDIAKRNMENVEENQSRKNTREDTLSLFQTASGKNVSVSETALKIARESWTNSNENQADLSSKESKPSFQTAAGNSVTVSDKALIAAREKFNESEEDKKDVPKFGLNSLFQTASGKTVNISAGALIAAKEHLKDDHKEFSIPKVECKSLFQTASGRTVNVSEKALKAARICLNDSEESVALVNSQVNDIPERAERKYQDFELINLATNLDDVKKSDSSTKQTYSKLFQSASGKNVHVSTAALNIARKNLLETSIDDNQSKIISDLIRSLADEDGFMNKHMEEPNASTETVLNMKRNLPLSKHDHGNSKRWKCELSDQQELEQTPAKRPRLDDGDDSFCHNKLCKYNFVYI